MLSAPGHSPVMVAALLLIALICAQAPSALAQGWPPEPKNLEFFPEDIEPRALIQEMRKFSFALGVRCQHCHVGESGQPLSAFDFASDEKPAKRKARAMLEMVEAINTLHLAKLEDQEREGLRVACVTCHRGVTHPEQLVDILVEVSRSEGADAAVGRYSELRAEYYGSGSYDFGEGSLIQAAELLARSDQAEAAVALLETCLLENPESRWALGTLAGVEEQRGNAAAALTALERILELDPDNEHVAKRIETLEHAAGLEPENPPENPQDAEGSEPER